MIKGSLSEWDNNVFVKLDPAYFSSTAKRDEYLEEETALLNSTFTAASQKYLRCKRTKCKTKLSELQTQYDADLAKMKAKISAVPVR